MVNRPHAQQRSKVETALFPTQTESSAEAARSISTTACQLQIAIQKLKSSIQPPYPARRYLAASRYRRLQQWCCCMVSVKRLLFNPKYHPERSDNTGRDLRQECHSFAAVSRHLEALASLKDGVVELRYTRFVAYSCGSYCRSIGFTCSMGMT